MSGRFDLHPPALPPSCDDLRREVRAFLAEEAAAGRIAVGRQTWTTWDRGFSERCGARGYIAMTWPRDYSGHERSALERFVVLEELLAGGAPLGAHWISDRQSGPQILRNGSAALKQRILPAIAAGRCGFAIGMSEPDSGSDLSSIRTRAERHGAGWRINGRKLWSTNAHHADYMILLARTSPAEKNRHAGLSQFVVDLRLPGLTVRPIQLTNGIHEFNEVLLEDVEVDADALLGGEGEGWRLVTEELAFERSGPDRFLSTFGLLRLAVDALAGQDDANATQEIGRLVVRLMSVRQMSLAIAGLLDRGQSPAASAALMKEIGTTLEQEIPEVVRRLVAVVPRLDGTPLQHALADAILFSPAFSLRGGTREILKGIVARELGLR